LFWSIVVFNKPGQSKSSLQGKIPGSSGTISGSKHTEFPEYKKYDLSNSMIYNKIQFDRSYVTCPNKNKVIILTLF
jgi:hypothetical protein